MTHRLVGRAIDGRPRWAACWRYERGDEQEETTPRDPSHHRSLADPLGDATGHVKHVEADFAADREQTVDEAT